MSSSEQIVGGFGPPPPVKAVFFGLHDIQKSENYGIRKMAVEHWRRAGVELQFPSCWPAYPVAGVIRIVGLGGSTSLP